MKISELPKEYQDLIPPPEERLHSTTDDLNNAFSWSDHFPGCNFWHKCYQTRSKDRLPPIPEKEKDGFQMIRTGKENYAYFVVDGLKYNIKFKKDSMSNCGMVLFHKFSFNGRINPKKYEKEIIQFYATACSGYPYALATHQEAYKHWFLGWEQIDEFKNPNSGNYVQVWKFDNTDNK